MQSKRFIRTLVGALVIGVLVGGLVGIFSPAGDDQASLLADDGVGGDEFVGSSGGFDPQQLREQIRSGEVSPEDLATLRNRLQGARSTADRTSGEQAAVESEKQDGAGRQPGTLRTMSADSIVISVGAEDITIGLTADTSVQSFVAGTVGDLVVDQETLFIGQRNEQGVEARLLIATPAGSEVMDVLRASFSGGGRGGRAGEVLGANLITGPITAIGTDTVTVETDRGSLAVLIDPDRTTLQVLNSISVEDLVPDERVIVTVGAMGTADEIVAMPNLRSLLGSIFGRPPS